MARIAPLIPQIQTITGHSIVCKSTDPGAGLLGLRSESTSTDSMISGARCAAWASICRLVKRGCQEPLPHAAVRKLKRIILSQVLRTVPRMQSKLSVSVGCDAIIIAWSQVLCLHWGHRGKAGGVPALRKAEERGCGTGQGCGSTGAPSSRSFLHLQLPIGSGAGLDSVPKPGQTGAGGADTESVHPS